MSDSNKQPNGILLHKERGGWRFGCSCWDASYATWPLVKLEIYSDKLIMICFFFEKVELLKSEIISITKYKGFFSSGVKISHNNSHVMPFIVFWPRSMRSLLTQLKTAGYPVTG